MAVVDRWMATAIVDGKAVRRRTKAWGMGKRWEVRYRDAAGRQRKARHDYKDDALLVEAASRVSPKAKSAETTVGDQFAAWKAGKASLKPKTLMGYQSAYRAHIEPELGARLISGLTATELRQWWARIDSRDSARHALVVLRGVLDLAVEDGMLPTNPVGSLSGGQTKRREVDPLTDAQLDALAASLATAGCDAEFWLLVGCGLRFGEMAALAPRRVRRLDTGWLLHIDRTVQLIDGQIIYGPPKTGKPRDVPCPLWLGERLATTGDLALPSPDGGPWLSDRWRTPWERARKAAGLDSLHTHDLRHAFAARQIDAGVDLKTLQYVMGHAHLSITTDLYGSMAKSRLDVIADITRPQMRTLLAD